MTIMALTKLYHPSEAQCFCPPVAQSLSKRTSLTPLKVAERDVGKSFHTNWKLAFLCRIQSGSWKARSRAGSSCAARSQALAKVYLDLWWGSWYSLCYGSCALEAAK